MPDVNRNTTAQGLYCPGFCGTYLDLIFKAMEAIIMTVPMGGGGVFSSAKTYMCLQVGFRCGLALWHSALSY